MTPILVAAVCGALAGVVQGGRITAIAATRLRWVAMLVLGVVTQLAGQRVIPGAGFALVVVSYLALASFALRNLALRGMAIVVVGVVLNCAPIVANAGMPVEGRAIVRAGIARPEELTVLRYGAKRHLAQPGDHLRVLDDAIPDWITGEVLSAGDLVIAVGVGAVAAGLIRPRSSRRRRLRSDRTPVAATSAAGPGRPATDSMLAASL
ncbi:MAG: hypothetical protein NVS3B12_05510 [Acidimicrobiales bacterium]